MDEDYNFFDELDDEDTAIVFGGGNGTADDETGFYFNGLFMDSTDPAYSIYSPTISDPKLVSDLTVQKAKATSTGNTKLLNTVDTILKYGERGIAMLVAAGVLSGPALAQSGYSNLAQDANGKLVIGSGATATQAAPLATNKIFGLDFSSPTVLIVTFIVIMLLIYFLFFDKKKKGK